MPTTSIMPAKAGSLQNLGAIIAHFDGYLWNMDAGGYYTLFNQALEDKIRQLTGRVIKPGDKVQDFPAMLDPSMAAIWEKICVLAYGGEPVKMVQEFRIKGQPAFFELSAIPVRHGGKIQGLSCLIEDLTLEYQNRQKLRLSETRFRTLIEKGSDIIVVMDGEGKIVYGSPSIGHYFGISDAEQLGANAFEYIHPDDLSRLAEKFLEVLESPGHPIAIEAKAITKEKKVLWVEGTVTNLLGTEGINGIVCNFKDVTERKNAERHLRQATIDAQDKEREEIGRELHDNVNQILTTARLYLDCIADGVDDQQDMIRRSSGIITTAIEEIRKLSRSMTQSFHPEVGLRLSVEDLVESIRRLAEGLRISLDFFMPDENVLDNKLKTALFRIIQEQLNNVLKHSEAKSVTVSVRQYEDNVLLQISDDGKGFDSAKKREGIGISNIINRAEVFHGQVTLDTAPGKGCDLSIHFPLGG